MTLDDKPSECFSTRDASRGFLVSTSDQHEPPATSRRTEAPLVLLLNPCGDFLHFAHDPNEIAAPHLRDLLLGVPAANELQRHVERLARVVPAFDAATAVEVRADADVIDADQLHGVVDVIDEVLHGGAGRWRELAV